MDTQTARRDQLRSLLGDLPDLDTAPTATVVGVESRPGYEVQRLLLDLNGIEPVPAYFVRPGDSGGERLPVVLYTHAHGGDLTIGKEELLRGRPELRDPPYAQALTRAGYAALCLDMWGFGERRGRTLDELFKLMLWDGRVLWGMMLYDSLRAVDYLASRSDVDTGRIATLGMSMGSTMAWWTAALDTRIAVCVDICCLTDYQALIRAGGLDRHGVYYYVPRLLTRFTTAGINALIAPRPHLGLAGLYDPLTPADGLDVIDEELRRVYAALDAPDAWRLSRYHCGHIETDGMRAEALAFLATWL